MLPEAYFLGESVQKLKTISFRGHEKGHFDSINYYPILHLEGCERQILTKLFSFFIGLDTFGISNGSTDKHHTGLKGFHFPENEILLKQLTFIFLL